MPASGGLRFAAARTSDASAIAGLHADSWRRHYRGAFSDAFLDGDVDSYLLTVWAERMRTPDPRDRTIVAELDGAIVGFAHTRLGNDPTWGALLDNLHVAYGLKRQGIGTRLLALTAQAVLDSSPAPGLYLWVLEQNSAARAFYEAQGGSCVQRVPSPPPGGDPANLNGKPVALRCAWPDASKLAGPFPAVPLARALAKAGISAGPVDR
jgi:ribosomal protein S18 acetylase RimI-like enzyme